MTVKQLLRQGFAVFSIFHLHDAWAPWDNRPTLESRWPSLPVWKIRRPGYFWRACSLIRISCLLRDPCRLAPPRFLVISLSRSTWHILWWPIIFAAANCKQLVFALFCAILMVYSSSMRAFQMSAICYTTTHIVFAVFEKSHTLLLW